MTGMPISAASQPMRITSVTWPWTLRMSVPPASMSCALAGGVEVFAGIDQRPRRGLAQQAQAFEIVAQDRIFDPHES